MQGFNLVKDQNEPGEKDNFVIDDERQDPSLSLFQKKYTHFDVNDYIDENPNPLFDSSFATASSSDDYYLKTECYYLIKYEEVFGTLVLKKDCLVFEPNLSPEHNQHLMNGPHGTQIKVEDYRGVIDYMDIIEVNKMNLVNEKAILSENAFIREAYRFNLFLQVVLTAVNGVTLRSNDKRGQNVDNVGAHIDEENGSAIVKRNTMPIANIYI